MKKKNKVIISILSILLFAVLAVGLYGWHNHRSAVKSANRESNEKYIKIEKSFKNSPNIDDALKLIDRYFYLEDYNKALFYANECIRLGVNQTPMGYLVNFQMAILYDKIGQQQKAKIHLNKAIELDRHGLIMKNNWIEKEDLAHLR